jgi:hypothetical protein
MARDGYHQSLAAGPRLGEHAAGTDDQRCKPRLSLLAKDGLNLVQKRLPFGNRSLGSQGARKGGLKQGQA